MKFLHTSVLEMYTLYMNKVVSPSPPHSTLCKGNKNIKCQVLGPKLSIHPFFIFHQFIFNPSIPFLSIINSSFHPTIHLSFIHPSSLIPHPFVHLSSMYCFHDRFPDSEPIVKPYPLNSSLQPLRSLAIVPLKPLAEPTNVGLFVNVDNLHL